MFPIPRFLSSDHSSDHDALYKYHQWRTNLRIRKITEVKPSRTSRRRIPLSNDSSNGRANNLGGFEALKFRGAKRDCVPCPLRAQCMRDPSRTVMRQVAIFIGRSKQAPPRYIYQMRQKIDTIQGRYQYSRRLGIVEPVFANICSALGLRRFTLRTKRKVDIQWKLYCMVHNLMKIHRYGVGFT